MASPGTDRAATRFDFYLSAFQQRHATRRISAGFGFASIGVEDAHPHVGHRGVLQDYQLVAADAGPAIRNCTCERPIHLQRLVARVEDDEVVPETVHFVEAPHHVGAI